MSPARIIGCIITAVLLINSHSAWALQNEVDDYKDMPGFVDFAEVFKFDDEESTVDIFLNQSLLRMLSKMFLETEPELAELVLDLDLVRVQRYYIADTDLDDLEKTVRGFAKKLESKNWMRVVRVREGNDNIYAYLQFNESEIHGVAVMAVESSGYVTFANIVGKVDPELLGKLGKRFNVEALQEDFDWEAIEEHNNARDKDRKDRNR